MKPAKRLGITAASIIEAIGQKKNSFDPSGNEAECVYGPPEWFESDGKKPEAVKDDPVDSNEQPRDSQKDTEDLGAYEPEANELEDVYGPPEWFENGGDGYETTANETEGVYGPPPGLDSQAYSPEENLPDLVYGPPEWFGGKRFSADENVQPPVYGPPSHR